MTVALMTALPTIVTKIEDGIAGDGIDTTDDEDVTYNHPVRRQSRQSWKFL
jgi:hypothetical protein